MRNVFKISSVGTIAGSYVLEGKITRGSKIRLVRDGVVITEDEISSLRRFKDDVKEVAAGYECGVGLAKYNDIHEGDIFEAYIWRNTATKMRQDKEVAGPKAAGARLGCRRAVACFGEGETQQWHNPTIWAVSRRI